MANPNTWVSINSPASSKYLDDFSYQKHYTILLWKYFFNVDTHEIVKKPAKLLFY